MGGTTSVEETKMADIPGCDVRLPESRISFNLNQLRALNRHFKTMVRNNENSYMPLELEHTVEALVQRLIDGVGKADPRFKCNHIIALHRDRKIRSKSLEYLIPLDALPYLDSTEECLLLEDPPGLGRVRLSGKLARQWSEFLTPGGYLAREKLVEKWLELLASRASAAARGKGYSPGRVLCPRSAARAKPGEYCYLEASSTTAKTLEYRLAIVETACWICLRLSDLPFGTGEAKLVLALKGRGPVGGEEALPINHPMALLYYEPAQKEWFLCAAGSPKGGAWSVRRAAAQAVISNHHSKYSGPSRVALTLNAVIDHLRSDAMKPAILTVSKRSVDRILQERLINTEYSTKDWAQLYTSHHVLICLDELLSMCRRNASEEGSYIWRGREAWRGTELGRRGATTGWRRDANIIADYIHGLHGLSYNVPEVPKQLSETLELSLVRRWESQMRELRGSYSSTSGEQPYYSASQQRYIWTVINVLLKSRIGGYNNNKLSTFHKNLISVTTGDQESLEDFLYITALVLEQAKDLYLRHHLGNQNEFNSKLMKKINKHKEYYAISCSCLLDAIRRNKNSKHLDLKDEVSFVTNLLDCLYKACKDDKKFMGPILEPFLKQLHTVSLENYYLLEEYFTNNTTEELQGFQEYCLEVNHERVDCNRGLLEAAKKYSWAKSLVDYADRIGGAKLTFPKEDGSKIKYPLVIGSHRYTMSLKLTRADKEEAKLKLARRCVYDAFNAALSGELDRPQTIVTDYPTAKSDEVLRNAKEGLYWRNETKPDIIASNLNSDKDNTKEIKGPAKEIRRSRRSRRDRPYTMFDIPGFHTVSLRSKYHTLKSLVYSDGLDSFNEDLKNGSKSAGSTLRVKEKLSKPGILETLDFINGLREAVCVADSSCSEAEDSSSSDKGKVFLIRELSPLAAVVEKNLGSSPQHSLSSILGAFIASGRFSVLQEICPMLGDYSDGVLLALHRLLRANRNAVKFSSVISKSSLKEHPTDRYRPISLDLTDRATGSMNANADHAIHKEGPNEGPVNSNITDFIPPKRFEDNTKQNDCRNGTTHQQIPSNHNIDQVYTGIIPMKNSKKDKFSKKRSKSLGRSFSTKSSSVIVENANSYNFSLGSKSGERVRNVLNSMEDNTTETGLDFKKSYFKKSSLSSVTCESYKVAVASYE